MEYGVRLHSVTYRRSLVSTTHVITSSALYTEGGFYQLALSVIVQENLISGQLKKFWEHEVSGLIDSKNESDVSENRIMKILDTMKKLNGIKEEIRKDRFSNPDENPHFETFEKDNLPYKVLGIAWNSREDFLYFDIKGFVMYLPLEVNPSKYQR
ncbi:hypothetical protein TNCV_2090291 [Trichonephila clavipes]|nr:hypothetical protein TNCV_2090291 [Trichonephila clavipes]